MFNISQQIHPIPLEATHSLNSSSRSSIEFQKTNSRNRSHTPRSKRAKSIKGENIQLQNTNSTDKKSKNEANDSLSSKESISLQNYALQRQIPSLQNQKMDFKTKINELSQKVRLNQEKSNKIMLKVLQIQLDEKQMLKLIIAQNISLETLKDELKEEKRKVQIFEDGFAQHEKNRLDEKNTVSRMRQAFKELIQSSTKLKERNQFQQRQISLLNQTIEELSAIISQKNVEIANLKSQLQKQEQKSQFGCQIQLFKQIQLEQQLSKIKKGMNFDQESEVIRHLEMKIMENQKQKDRLQVQVEKMTIQLNYLNRKHVTEFRAYNKSKQYEINCHKKRYTELFNKYQMTRKELDESIRRAVSDKNIYNNSQAEEKYESIAEVRNMKKKDHISFELSEEDSF